MIISWIAWAFALPSAIRIISLAFIIDSPIAVANYYIASKNKKFSHNIGFIDIGASGSWISIFSFTSMGKTDVVMNQKSLVVNSSLGGNYIDQIIGDFLYNKFVEKTVERNIERAKRMFNEDAINDFYAYDDAEKFDMEEFGLEEREEL